MDHILPFLLIGGFILAGVVGMADRRRRMLTDVTPEEAARRQKRIMEVMDHVVESLEIQRKTLAVQEKQVVLLEEVKALLSQRAAATPPEGSSER